MSLSTRPLPVVRSAFERFIDYAGLFPPARLDMDAALFQFAGAKNGSDAWMLGRFIVPASRLREAAPAGELSVILDAEPDPRRWFSSAQRVAESVAAARASGVAVSCLEIPLPPLERARDTFDATIGQAQALLAQYALRDVPAFYEIPRASWKDGLSGALDALARSRAHAKVRCGGITADAFPRVEEIAAFVIAARDAEVAFKATAGLHHPVRHTDAATGFPMHGFLNLLCAAGAAAAGRDELVAQILGEEDALAFSVDERGMAWRNFTMDGAAVAALRRDTFVSYGSCSFAEPIDDLTALGLLAN